MLNPVTGTTWGTDPEGFFQNNGVILGSERFIPKNGLKVGAYGEITRDGVQFEMHPRPNFRLSQLVNNTAQLLIAATKLAKRKNCDINYQGLVTVTRKELNSLSPETRVLGCMPSENYYGHKPITVDAVKYRKRSSGGHIHFGLPEELMELRADLAPLCDILVGTVATLLDRDPGAAERRENYGRAGEYRLPSYGFEYRTVSNFWLRDPFLMRIVFGMANMAVSILKARANGDNGPWGRLTTIVDIKKVVKAIDNSDYDIALDNFKTLYPFFQEYVGNKTFPINLQKFDSFLEFSENLVNRGIDQVYPTPGITFNWAKEN